MMTDVVSNIIIQLTLISMIKRNYQLNITNLSITRYPSLYGTVYRSVNGENRQRTFQYVQEIMDAAFQMVRSENNTNISNKIMDAIIKSKEGIRNMEITYSSDEYMVSKINTLLTAMDVNLESLVK